VLQGTTTTLTATTSTPVLSPNPPVSGQAESFTDTVAGLAAGALLIAGCNGGFSSPPITPTGKSVITIAGTRGVMHSWTIVTIIVK
jgi:hypothetical protein